MNKWKFSSPSRKIKLKLLIARIHEDLTPTKSRTTHAREQASINLAAVFFIGSQKAGANTGINESGEQWGEKSYWFSIPHSSLDEHRSCSGTSNGNKFHVNFRKNFRFFPCFFLVFSLKMKRYIDFELWMLTLTVNSTDKQILILNWILIFDQFRDLIRWN